MDRAYAWGVGRRAALFIGFVCLAACTPVSSEAGAVAIDSGPDGETPAADGGEPDSRDGGGGTETGAPKADAPKADAPKGDTPKSDTPEGGTPEDNTPKGEKCTGEGSYRCSGDAGATRAREICQAGVWAEATACADGEVCAAASGGGVTCLGVAGICRGNPSAAVCDSKGVLYHCGADGVIVSMESCPSARSCQAGLAAMSCAACAPGEYRCQGDALERCNPGGTGFNPVETCAAGSCDATSGQCRGGTCSDARSVCRGDVLWSCAKGDKDLHEVSRCEPGLCDATRGICNKCVPGIDSCEDQTALRCSDEGATQDRVDCTKEGGHCVGAGRCVDCARDTDCVDPSACMRAYCNLAKGKCEPQPLSAGSKCPTGVCSATGECVGCVNASDCADPGQCRVRQCDAGSCNPKPAASGQACGSGSKCDGQGNCAACIADGDCPEPPACQVRHCDLSSNTCDPAPAPKGTKCQAGVCDGDGKCAGCNADADCPAVGACQQKFCNPSSHVCEPKSAADGGACNAAFGAGSCLTGRCVQCAGDGDCKAASECQSAVCRPADHTCQQQPLAVGASCSGDKVCDGSAHCVQCTTNAQCGANSTCTANVCRCNAGTTPNTSGKGCNLDECAKPDDNHCGADSTTGNTCTNTQDSYSCTCASPWRSGAGQCFQSGTGQSVKNTSSWNVLPNFEVVCDNAFDTNNPCPNGGGQLTWLNVCGLQGAAADSCNGLAGKNDNSLGSVTLRRVSYAGALENYPGPAEGDVFTNNITLPTVGDVILVQSLTSLYVMRITAMDSATLTYDWAIIWRDACWRPGGVCTASCNCPGGI